MTVRHHTLCQAAPYATAIRHHTLRQYGTIRYGNTAHQADSSICYGSTAAYATTVRLTCTKCCHELPHLGHHSLGQYRTPRSKRVGR
eukprot:3344943-Rhodomonas_salina.2